MAAPAGVGSASAPEPVIPEPDATEADATEPDATEAAATEPAATEADATEADAPETESRRAGHTANRHSPRNAGTPLTRPTCRDIATRSAERGSP